MPKKADNSTSVGEKNTKEKLLNVALKLFYDNGYDKTSVNTIVKTAQVSKGAFYHYFNSKEEILEVVISEHAKKSIEVSKEVVEDKSLNAIDKFNKYLVVIGQYKSVNMDKMVQLDAVINHKDNLRLKEKFMKKFFEFAKQPIIKIISQGVKEKIFNTPSPEDAAMMILHITISMSEQMMDWISDLNKHPENVKLIEKKIAFIEDSIARILGLEKKNGNIKLMAMPIKDMLELMKKARESKEAR